MHNAGIKSKGRNHGEQAKSGPWKATASMSFDSHDPQLFAYPLLDRGQNAAAKGSLVPNVDIPVTNVPYRMRSGLSRMFPARNFS